MTQTKAGTKKVLMRVGVDVWARMKMVAARRGETVWGYLGEVLLAVVEVEEGKPERVTPKTKESVEGSVREALEVLFGKKVYHTVDCGVVSTGGDAAVEQWAIPKNGASTSSPRVQGAEQGEGDEAFRGKVDGLGSGVNDIWWT